MTDAEKTPQPQEITVVDKHGQHHRGAAVLLDSDEVVREQYAGFVHFLRDYAVVGLAVGFIIGQQAQTLIKQLVDSFVTPLLTVIIGQNVQTKSFSIASGSHQATVSWGKFVYVFLDFVCVMIFIYLLVKLLKLDKFVQRKVKK
jgi:large conductance mechanosensitive channel